MKHALYHQENKPALKLEILAKNPDGTVNLGAAGRVIVSECAITETPEPGSCTLPPAAEQKASKAAKATKGEEGKPNQAELAPTAEADTDEAETPTN